MLLPIDSRHDVHLSNEKATLLITLYAKAMDYQSKRPILGDKGADELVRSIDYDFAKFNGAGNDNLTVVRAKQYDDWIREFIANRPEALILQLGCGLDTRVIRINPPATVTWYDLDYPEVIELRRQFFATRPGYAVIASSVTDSAWLEPLPNDQPVMIVAEGLMEYLTEADVTTLLNRLTGHFAHGELVFDVLSSFAVKAGKSELETTTGAAHTWAVDDTRVIEMLDPKLKTISNLSFLEAAGVSKLPLGFRLLFTGGRLIPRFRNMMRLLRYQF